MEHEWQKETLSRRKCLRCGVMMMSGVIGDNDRWTTIRWVTELPMYVYDMNLPASCDDELVRAIMEI